MTKPSSSRQTELPQRVGISPRKAGRPALYREEMLPEVTAMAKMGATDEELAAHLGIKISTFYMWKNKYPRLVEAINEGKSVWDQRVEASLARKAMGYRYTEQQAFKLREKNGDDVSETIEIVELEREMPADTAAAIIWLSNRNPNRWRNRQQVDVEQTVTVDHTTDVRALALATMALLTQAANAPAAQTIEGTAHEQADQTQARDDTGKPDPGHGAGQANDDLFI